VSSAGRLGPRQIPVSLGLTPYGCRGSDTATMMAKARQYRERGDIKAALIQLKNIIQQDAGHRAARARAGRRGQPAQP
jgi:hypothetical protein